MTIQNVTSSASVSPTVAARIAAAQTKCSRATSAVTPDTDVFERVGKPGDDAAALGTMGCCALNPTVWVGATVGGILTEIGSLLGLVTAAVLSPCEGTITTSAAKDT